jgi:hypothetical protein
MPTLNTKKTLKDPLQSDEESITWHSKPSQNNEENIIWHSEPSQNNDEYAALFRQNVENEAPKRNYSLGEIPLQWPETVLPSAGKALGGMYNMVAHPIQTAQTIADTGAGALRSALPKNVVDFIDRFDNPENIARISKAANDAGEYYKDRFGGYEQIKRTLAEDPVGSMLDLSMLFSGGAGVTKGIAPQISKNLESYASLTNPLNAIAKPATFLAKNRLVKQLNKRNELANTVKLGTIEAAQKKGYMVNPSSVNPTGVNFLERMAGKSDLQQLMSINNQKVTDNLARASVGLPKDAPLTSKTMQQVRKTAYETGFEPLNKIGIMPTDKLFHKDLSDIKAKYTGPEQSFPKAGPDGVGRLVSNHTVDQFHSKDGLIVIRNLRDQASADFRKGENALAKAQIEIANALEHQIARHLEETGNVAALEKFRTARKQMAISHIIEDAIREGTGSVDAKKLASDLQKDKYMTGELRTAADFASAVPHLNTSPQANLSPTPLGFLGKNVTMGNALSALIGGTLSGDMYLGSAAGVAAKELLAKAANARLMSKKGQKNLLNEKTGLAEEKSKPKKVADYVIKQWDKKVTKNVARGVPDEAVNRLRIASETGALVRNSENNKKKKNALEK